MKKRTTILILVPVLLFSVISCKKGSFAPETYFASVQVTSSQLSTTPLLVQFDDAASRDTLAAGGDRNHGYEFTGQEIKEGKPVRLKVYKTGTDELIADSSILLHKNEKPTFKVIYSQTLGIAGFMSPAAVPADSIRLRIRYIDNTPGKQLPNLQVTLYQYQTAAPNYDPNNNISLPLTFSDGLLTPEFCVPAKKKDGIGLTYLVMKCVDPVTGKNLDFSAAVKILPLLNTNGLWDGQYGIITVGITNNTNPIYYKSTVTSQRL